MAEFLTTKGIASRIEEIINYAKKELYLISPYYQLSDTFYNRLYESTQRRVITTIVFGKERMKNREFYALAEFSYLELLYCDNLHAKCYFNENNMVIGSMNMYAFSERNNREMGIYIDRVKDTELFEKARQEAYSIMNTSEVIRSRLREKCRNDEELAYCIRCESSIPPNPKRPYCQNCYSIWNEFNNPDYEENFCHLCGGREYTSFRKPLCYDCYSNSGILN
ncbi:phospholipase D-like domain-containing protein [Halalkalibaculum sp. DA3122]|uniref:phospholipase D-like domain-containing protein n=1 Tax=Halalkalibaculum sp. DA3122 TaxID=3373607 RepID=UPI003754B44D